MRRIAPVTAVGAPELEAAVDDLLSHLVRCGFERTVNAEPGDIVLVVTDHGLSSEVIADLLARASAASPVLLLGPAAACHAERDDVVEAAGVVLEAAMPTHETRLRPGAAGADLFVRGDDVVLVDSWLRVDKVRDDVEVLATAMGGRTEHPVITWRPSSGVGLCTVGSRPQTLSDPQFRRLVQRWLRHVSGIVDARPARVGIIGYGAIGHEHNEAIAAVDGLDLVAVCDRSSQRIDAARSLAPDLRGYVDAEDLIDADDIDVVIVSTPPNTHADWALRALEAGKHVVVEKPFCLTTAEADELVSTAAARSRLLTVYQNRRWDADYLALKRIVRSGVIGELFHYESFVGGYGHPCNYWHSDEEISGGAIYDWGSHYLDWVLDLIPHDIDYVAATTHKRVWHDVTNADHSRVQVRFAGGIDAEFIHSDLAAAMKPKWYVLGTQGAVVGDWRRERVIARNNVGNLVEDVLAAADSPATLRVHAADGSVTEVAIASAPQFPFHRELADQLLSGAPMSVTAEGSRRNIAVMEAATTSARDNGRPVRPL